MTSPHHCRRLSVALLLLGAAGATSNAGAQGFAAIVSPPRLEVAAKPGERTRQVVEITNASGKSATYHVKTADWSLAADGGVSFSDELAPDTCRPWVAIERRDVEVPGGGTFRYRFDIQPPADTPARECRFALMIEGDPTQVQTAGGFSVPVNGRIGVIVYAAIGDVAPDLQIAAAGVIESDGKALPAVTVHNAGTAHGRVGGFLSGTEEGGRKLDFTPSSQPILPGETRTIPLNASDGSAVIGTIAYPVRVKGVLEWGDGERTEFDHLYPR